MKRYFDAVVLTVGIYLISHLQMVAIALNHPQGAPFSNQDESGGLIMAIGLTLVIGVSIIADGLHQKFRRRVCLKRHTKFCP